MRRIASWKGKAAALGLYVGALALVVDTATSFFALYGGIAVLSLVLGRAVGGLALAAPPAATVPLVIVGNNAGGEAGGYLVVFALIGGAIGLGAALLGVGWYAWAWTGTITRAG